MYTVYQAQPVISILYLMMAKYKHAFVGYDQLDCLCASTAELHLGMLFPSAPNLPSTLSYKNPSLIYCTIIPLTPVVTCSIRVTRYSEGWSLNKPVRATQLCNTLAVTGSNNSTHLSHTGPACSLCWPDLLSLPNCNSNVPWLQDNKNTSRENDFHQAQTQREEETRGGCKSKRIEHFDWQGRVNKDDKSFILPLPRLCSGCHYKAMIDNNISTHRRDSSHSQLRNIQRNCSKFVDGVCMCVCGHACTHSIPR